MGDQHRKRVGRLNNLPYGAIILFSLLLVVSGGFTIQKRHKDVKREIEARNIETDARARDVNHFLDEVPKCIVGFLIPFPVSVRDTRSLSP